MLYFLAKQTGGLAFLNTNDLAGALGRVADDLNGYYLLGFDLPDDKPRKWDPGRVYVRMRRPGLRVRWRQGIFGPGGTQEKSDAPRDPVMMAAVSPFYANAITVRLTSLFGHDAKQGAYIRSLLFVEPNALSFTKAADGRHEAKLEVVLLAVGDNGQVPGNRRRLITLRLMDAQPEDAQTQGVVYHARMVVKKPGGYQVRAAVRDMATGALGRSPETPVAPRPTKPKGKNAARVVPIAGLLTLGEDVPPGAYTLQVIVNAGKKRTALQFADFEVRR